MIRLDTLIELKSQFEPFELVLFLKLDKRFPVEQFEATVSKSTVYKDEVRDSYTLEHVCKSDKNLRTRVIVSEAGAVPPARTRRL